MTLHRRLAAMVGVLALAASPGPVNAKPPEPVVAASNAFGVDLYHALRQRDGALFFSPFNISTAFSMAASGARGPTAAEMRAVLHQPISASEVDAVLGRVSREIAADREGVKVHFANAVWLDNAFSLAAPYRQTMEGPYASKVQRVDFAGDGEGARQAINRWVEAETADRIKDLLPAPVLGPMVITSAVYLKADWATGFDKAQTQDGDFRATGGATVRTPLMHARTGLRLLDERGFQAVAIPYHRADLSMVLFLPKRVDGLGKFEQSLTAVKLEAWLDALSAQPPSDVALTLPRYRLEDQFTMKALLEPMGMRQAFTDTADFSGIDGLGALKIDDAIHKTFLAVDEDGTEAAATTAIIMVVSGERRYSSPPIEFRADHPFFFLVRDDRSGAILFMGRLEKPSS